MEDRPFTQTFAGGVLVAVVAGIVVLVFQRSVLDSTRPTQVKGDPQIHPQVSTAVAKQPISGAGAASSPVVPLQSQRNSPGKPYRYEDPYPSHTLPFPPVRLSYADPKRKPDHPNGCSVFLKGYSDGMIKSFSGPACKGEGLRIDDDSAPCEAIEELVKLGFHLVNVPSRCTSGN